MAPKKEMIRIIATLSNDAPDIHTVAQHLATCGLAVEHKLPLSGIVSGHCFRDALDRMGAVAGVAAIEEEAVARLSGSEEGRAALEGGAPWATLH
jgi:hypothetical protein